MSPLLKNKLKSRTPKAMLTKYCLVSGLLAIVMMMFVYAVHANTLFGGDNTVLRMDLYHQYGPLFSELYDRVTHGYSLVYSWTTGLGSSFTGNLFNYCASPFAIFIFLTGHKNMPEAIAFMILFKAVLSSMTFTYYINKTNKANRTESVAFGLLYAFCSYFVAYSWNVMWLDAMAVFPLVILGIERIINRNKPALYIVMLTYVMFTNYYMAYMVCILSVIYYLYFYFGRYKFSDRINVKKTEDETVSETVAAAAEIAPVNGAEETAISENDDSSESAQTEIFAEEAAADSAEITEEKVADLPAEAEEQTYTEEISAEQLTQTVPVITETKEDKKKKKKKPIFSYRFWRTGTTFAVSSVICFLIAAVALIPVVYCLSTSSATSGSFPTEIKYYFNFFDFIANHLPSLETTIRSSGDDVLPNVYCGMLTVLLIPMYFLNTDIPGRKKIAAASILGVFYLGFSINYLNFIWHGFHMPNDLPYRYSFAYSFILLTLAYQAFIHIENLTKKTVVGVGLGAMLFIVIIEELGSKNVTKTTVYESLIFTGIYCIFLGLMLTKKARKNVLAMMISVITMGELMFADSTHFTMQQSKKNYTGDYDDYQSISEEVEKDDSELFYRTELSKLRARMDPSWFGYNGVSVFSSMAYEHVAKLMEKMGLFGNDINSYTYYPQTTLFNSIFNLRYIYDNEKLINSDTNYTEVSANESYTAYKYNYYLPLAFGVSGNLASWKPASSNPFENQNGFVRCATSVTDALYEAVDATDVETSNLSTVSVDSVNNGESFYVSKLKNGESAKVTVKIEAEEAGNYYVYAGSTKLSSIKFNADNFEYSYYSSAIQPFTLDVGYQEEGSEITVEYEIDSAYDNATLTFCAAKLNDEAWQNVYTELSKQPMKLENFDETVFSGTVKMSSDGILYTSVPYDESWNITVDGEKLTYTHDEDDAAKLGDVVLVGGALFGIKLSKGEHSVEFRYEQKGFSEGIKLTCIGAVLCAALLVWNFIIRRKNLLKSFRPLLLEEITEWKD